MEPGIFSVHTLGTYLEQSTIDAIFLGGNWIDVVDAERSRAYGCD